MNSIFKVLCPALLAVCGCARVQYVPVETARADSTVTRVETRTEYVPDTVFVEIPFERERRTVRDTASHLETSYAVSDAALMEDGTLYHSLENKAQKRPYEAKREVVYRDSTVYRDKVVTGTEYVEVPREPTWWEKARLATWKWLAAALALCAGYGWLAYRTRK